MKLPRHPPEGTGRTVRLPGPLLAAAAALVFAAAPPGRAAGTVEPPKRVYQAVRLTGPPPRIDGRLDDPCWNLGRWAGHYRQREPNQGQPGSQPTELKVLYDDRNVYVAIRAFDSELASQPRLRGKRDEFIGDMVGVSFDSYFDHRTAFEFDVTSGGSKIDLLTSDGNFDTSWNAVWDVKVGTEPGAWTAEFRIPLSQLRYADKPEQVWGMHSWRWINRRQEESNWQLIPLDNPGFVLSFGELRGLRDLPRARRLELLPYTLGRYATSAVEAGNPYRRGGDTDAEAGLDAKIGLASNFTLDATINPDFGQVEADPSVINLTTYETFFEERRPFFLEGKNILDFRLDDDLLFYSRRIGHRPTYDPPTSGFKDVPTSTRILGAAKVTGKAPGGLSVGVLYGLTDREEAHILEGGVERSQAVEPLTHYIVARVQQDYDRGRTVVGGMATATVRELGEPALAFLPERAFTAGADVKHRWNDRSCYLDARVVGSQVEGDPAAISALMRNPVHNYQRPGATHLGVDPMATRLSGSGGLLEVGKDNNGRWLYHAAVDWRSPGLELNDLGFLSVADRLEERTWLRYVVTEPGAHVRRYNIDFDQRRTYDFHGTRLQDMVGMDGGPTFNRNWSLWGHAGYFTELVDTRVLRGGPALLMPRRMDAGVEISSDSSKEFRYWLQFETERSLDGGSRKTEIKPGITVRLFNIVNVEAEVSYATNLDDFQYAGTATTGSAHRYLMGRMDQNTLRTTLRFDINFTPQLSLTYFGSLFASTGSFSDLKLVTRPLAARYEDRFRRIDARTAYDPAADSYSIADSGLNFDFKNPDFALREFKSNFVLRWEYRPGSILYAVWTQNRDDTRRLGDFSAGSEYRRLFGAHPDNTFLLKISYWFNL